MSDEQRKVTIYDVARDAGVSFGTVSRVLNQRKDVSEKTRRSVLASIRRLGYVSHPFARGLARSATGLMGFVSGGARASEDRHAYYALELQQGVLRGAKEVGLHVVLIDDADCRPPEYDRFSLLVEGLVVRGNLPEESRDELCRRFPVVGINSTNIAPTVQIDHSIGASEAVRHLLELGHRRIAIVPGTGRAASPAKSDRLAAYRRALTEQGIPLDPRLEAPPVDLNDPLDLYQRLESLFALDQPPTALFIAGDVPALEAVRYVTQRGLTVPGDISVIGSTDLPIGRLAQPALTTVHIPLEEIGAEASRFLWSMIRDPEREVVNKTFLTHLVVRGSTAPPSDRR